MKKIVLILTAVVLWVCSCADTRNLSPQEQEAYRKSYERYQWGQRGGP